MLGERGGGEELYIEISGNEKAPGVLNKPVHYMSCCLPTGHPANLLHLYTKLQKTYNKTPTRVIAMLRFRLVRGSSGRLLSLMWALSQPVHANGFAKSHLLLQ